MHFGVAELLLNVQLLSFLIQSFSYAYDLRVLTRVLLSIKCVINNDISLTKSTAAVLKYNDGNIL